MKTVLPALMKKHGVDMWVVPMREYNEDPVFSSIVSPTTFNARRRTIYLFFDPCAGDARRCTKPFERLAMGGTSQGGVLQRHSLDEGAVGTRGRPGAGAGRALGRRAVAGAEDRDREAQSEGDRDRRLDACSRSTTDSRPASSRECATRSARNGRRSSSTPTISRSISSPRASPRRQSATRIMQHVVWGIIDTAFSNVVDHAGRHAHRRRRVVDAAEGQRSRTRHVVPSVGRSAAQRRDRRAARRESDHSEGRRAALRLRHHRDAPQHGYAAHGLRAARRRDRRAAPDSSSR